MKAAYWRAVDLKRPNDAIACLVPEGAVIDFEGIPRCEGRAAFLTILQAGAARGAAFDMHHGCNPHIELTGPDAAEAKWTISYRGLDAGMRTRTQLAGEYADRYVRTSEGWRIAAMTMRVTSITMRDIDRLGAQRVMALGPQGGAFVALPDRPSKTEGLKPT